MKTKKTRQKKICCCLLLKQDTVGDDANRAVTRSTDAH